LDREEWSFDPASRETWPLDSEDVGAAAATGDGLIDQRVAGETGRWRWVYRGEKRANSAGQRTRKCRRVAGDEESCIYGKGDIPQRIAGNNVYAVGMRGCEVRIGGELVALNPYPSEDDLVAIGYWAVGKGALEGHDDLYPTAATTEASWQINEANSELVEYLFGEVGWKYDRLCGEGQVYRGYTCRNI